MVIKDTNLEDCKVIEMSKFGDERGFFLESFNFKKLKDKGIDFEVKQINFAQSQKNVLRGLHFQKDDFAQAKLVGVITGSVKDVVVDLRETSKSYLKHFMINIDKPNIFLFVPRGFAHGYVTQTDNAIFHYAVDNYYSPEHEDGIKFDDPKLQINWGVTNPIVSNKDMNLKNLNI